ncbi:MAG: pyridoxamine 5'-phosphate oxidase family protein, partial [Clostridia bacterium]|nr:pyridoxamine 5'-phosphate oxidase family protein [Clostridia bacterium]
MFREMRRFKQKLDDKDCVNVLKTQFRGVLSMIGDNGYPYGIPMDHWYSEKDNTIYFHCAKTGHKLDAISACDKVSYFTHVISTFRSLLRYPRRCRSNGRRSLRA